MTSQRLLGSEGLRTIITLLILQSLALIVGLGLGLGVAALLLPEPLPPPNSLAARPSTNRPMDPHARAAIPPAK